MGILSLIRLEKDFKSISTENECLWDMSFHVFFVEEFFSLIDAKEELVKSKI